MLQADGAHGGTPTSPSFTRGFTLNAARASIIGRFRGGSTDSAGIPAVNMGQHSVSPSLDYARRRGSSAGEKSASTVSHWWHFGPGAIAVTIVLILCTILVEAAAVAISVTSSFRRRTAWIASAIAYLAGVLFTVQVLVQRIALGRSSSSSSSSSTRSNADGSGTLASTLLKDGTVDDGSSAPPTPQQQAARPSVPTSLRDLSASGSTRGATAAAGCCNSVTGVPIAFLFAFSARVLWFVLKAITEPHVCGDDETYAQHKLSWRDVLATGGTVLNRVGTALWFTAFTIVGAFWEASSAALEGSAPDHAGALNRRCARCDALLSTPTCQRLSGRVGRSCGFITMVLVNTWLYLFFGILAATATWLRTHDLLERRAAFITGVNVTIEVELQNAQNLRNIAAVEAYGEAVIAIVLISSLVLIAVRLVRRMGRASGGVSGAERHRLFSLRWCVCCAPRTAATDTEKGLRDGDELLGTLVCRIRLVLSIVVVGVAFKPLMFMLNPPPFRVRLQDSAALPWCTLFYPWAFYEIPELLPAVGLLILITPSCSGAALHANLGLLKRCCAWGGGSAASGSRESIELEAPTRDSRVSSASFDDQPMVYM